MADNYYQDAAVLMPVYRDVDNDVCLVVIRRSNHGVHGGQIAFPGGKYESDDASPLETALRETYEEIGLDRQYIDILAEFPPTNTRTTGFRIFPFLGRLVPPEAWIAQTEEVDAVLTIKLKQLAESWAEDVVQFPTWPAPRRIEYYQIGQGRLWGLSYRIFQPLLPRILAGEWVI